jgi:hypothetical protein
LTSRKWVEARRKSCSDWLSSKSNPRKADSCLPEEGTTTEQASVFNNSGTALLLVPVMLSYEVSLFYLELKISTYLSLHFKGIKLYVLIFA